MRRISFCLIRRSLIFVFRARKGRGIADAGSVNGAARIARPCNDERAIMKAMWSKSVKYIRSGGAVSRLRMKARLRQQHTQSDGKAITEIEEGADVKYWQQGDVGRDIRQAHSHLHNCFPRRIRHTLRTSFTGG